VVPSGNHPTPGPSMPPMPLINLVFNKPAFQRGVIQGKGPYLAVDGDKERENSIFTEIRGWWKVDLEAMASISRIVIYNSDHPWHLRNAYILVLDNNFEVTAGYHIIEYNHDVIEIDFSGEYIEGRYVKISIWEW